MCPPACASQQRLPAAYRAAWLRARRGRASATTFIKKSGFARWADTNRLVILFPQVAGSVVNPHGCWDWWGYSDIDYLGKDAPQIAAIWAMAERLAPQP